MREEHTDFIRSKCGADCIKARLKTSGHGNYVFADVGEGQSELLYIFAQVCIACGYTELYVNLEDYVKHKI
jgi:predicted nucleic-acid-binding Zn-ribbon protein